MTSGRRRRIKTLLDRIPELTNGQLYWLERVIQILESSHTYRVLSSGLFDSVTLESFGDALRIHHSFSAEPFSKDKFEYVLAQVLNMSGHDAHLAPKGNRGHDITIDDVKYSLKTQADKGIKEDKLWISKFMELGKGNWGDDPQDLVGLIDLFLEHLSNYERILVLRALRREPAWKYELVEIPVTLMFAAREGDLDMRMDSSQFPKPGYCHVRAPDGPEIYQLYFDGGSERKLQVKNLLKSKCILHADWNFVIPTE